MLELLRDYVGEMKSFQYLAHFLDACSAKSMPSKHGVDNLIRPAMLIMMYVRPEGEGDFSFHLHACYEMMPYFLAAGVQITPGLRYLRKMQKLPGFVLEQFLKGEHVVHHRDENWNGIRNDMMIEST